MGGLGAIKDCLRLRLVLDAKKVYFEVSSCIRM